MEIIVAIMGFMILVLIFFHLKMIGRVQILENKVDFDARLVEILTDTVDRKRFGECADAWDARESKRLARRKQ